MQSNLHQFHCFCPLWKNTDALLGMVLHAILTGCRLTSELWYFFLRYRHSTGLIYLPKVATSANYYTPDSEDILPLIFFFLQSHTGPFGNASCRRRHPHNMAYRHCADDAHGPLLPPDNCRGQLVHGLISVHVDICRSPHIRHSARNVYGVHRGVDTHRKDVRDEFITTQFKHSVLFLKVNGCSAPCAEGTCYPAGTMI